VPALPILFAFPDVIVGNGFAARVEVRGRALLKPESGGAESWLYGAAPGVVAGGGADPSSACREFRKTYQSVLFDIASEAPNYEAFEREVRALLGTANESVTAEWNEALRSVRANPEMKTGFTWVPAESWPPMLTVTKLDQGSMRPDLNQLDEVAEAA